MWLLSNSWKFFRQILYTCLAGYCPLKRCFSRKLRYIYEIDIMPNFMFEFCNLHIVIFYVMLRSVQLFPNLLEKTGSWAP